MKLKTKLGLAAFCTVSSMMVYGGRAFAADAPGPTWFKPQISVYQAPVVEKSTSPVFRAVDPQIIQKLIDLLEETSLGRKEVVSPDEPPSSLEQIKTLITPIGRELGNRYQHLGIALSESLGWEPIKHVRVISEQNIKQRLTTVARWDHAPNVRSIALIALASLKDENDFVYFKEALWSRNIGIRFATIEALLQWNFPQAVAILQDLAAKDESTLIRVAAASALAKMSRPEGITMLRDNFQSKDWLVRALSAKALGESGGADEYDFLVDQLSREQAYNSNDFVNAEISIAAIRLFPLKQEKEEQEKEAKRRKKANLPPPPPRPAPKPKSDVLFELEPLVVTAPRLKITQEEPVDPRVDFQLLKMLREKIELGVTQEMSDQSPAYRDMDSLITPNGIRLKTRYNRLGYLLTEGLAGTRDFQLVDELMRLARGERALEQTRIRYFALIALAYNHDRNHLNLFQQALRSEFVDERFAAVEALQIWGLEEAGSILTGVSRIDTSSFIKTYAAQAAWRLGDLNGRDHILRGLDDPDWVARAMSMRYLGELGGAEDYNKLLGYLGSQQRGIVQAEMCSALLRLYAKKFEQDRLEEQQGK